VLNHSVIMLCTFISTPYLTIYYIASLHPISLDLPGSIY
jgi:hypothetical protein